MTKADNQKINAFATQMANGTYKIQEMLAEPGFQVNLAHLLEHLKTTSSQVDTALTTEQQVETLSRDAQAWLVQEKIIKPGEIGTNDKAILNDLARMVLAMKAGPTHPPAKRLEPEEPVPPQPVGNRVAPHQPALTEFLNTLPQTLLNRNGTQTYQQLRDQMLDIALRALQQQFLGGQALTDDERNHVVGLVDQALKPFESLVGRVLHPQYPPNLLQPGQIQPIATQPSGLRPTMISPYTQQLTMPGGFGPLCPFLGYPGMRAGLPAFGFSLNYLGR